jgi:hypothetical protein
VAINPTSQFVEDVVRHHPETGVCQAAGEPDEETGARVAGPPRAFQYVLQGLAARPLFEKVSSTPLPDATLFDMASRTVVGRHVRGLRHGVAGQPRFALFVSRPRADMARDTIVAGDREETAAEDRGDLGVERQRHRPRHTGH